MTRKAKGIVVVVAVVVLGALVGIAHRPIPAGALGSLALEGVWDLPSAGVAGTAWSPAQPGIRTYTVNSADFSGVIVICTLPSQGYRVACVSATVCPPSGIWPLPATNRFTYTAPSPTAYT